MEEEYIEEVDTDLTVNDYVFISVGVLGVCLVLAFIFRLIKKTFKNVKFKVGDKINVDIETKD